MHRTRTPGTIFFEKNKRGSCSRDYSLIFTIVIFLSARDDSIPKLLVRKYIWNFSSYSMFLNDITYPHIFYNFFFFLSLCASKVWIFIFSLFFFIYLFIHSHDTFPSGQHFLLITVTNFVCFLFVLVKINHSIDILIAVFYYSIFTLILSFNEICKFISVYD